MKRTIKPAAVLLSLVLAFSASAQAAVEGVDYTVLKNRFRNKTHPKSKFWNFSAISAYIAKTLIPSCCHTAKLSRKMFTCVPNTSSGCLKCWAWRGLLQRLTLRV